jgi:KDO2-lipid IV(A) lauroyltransferase
LRPQNLFPLTMDTILYYLASGIIGLFQKLSLDGASRVGRFLGGIVYTLDARHRKVAINNLTMCFGKEKSPEEIRALAKENFKRIGENFLSAIRSSRMTYEQLSHRIEVIGAEKVSHSIAAKPTASVIIAIGHFGNFELFAQLARELPRYQRATTYRALKNPAINRVMQRLREGTGCLYFERRNDGAALRTALRTHNLLLGLLSDQHSGDHGLRLPFLGHDCNTTKAPAIFALRYDMPLHTAICFRTKPGHWQVEVGDAIPTHVNGEPRSPAAIMLDVNRAFEIAVRRDPANWFWVHKRWKPSRLKSSLADATEGEDDSESAADKTNRSAHT